MRCLTNSRMSMVASVLKVDTELDEATDLTSSGHWTKNQDPLTGEIVRVWEPVEDDVDTPDNEAVMYDNVPCIARGVVNGGIRAAGTTERIENGMYMNVDYIQMWMPAWVNITKRDRITNIRGPQGDILWMDNENEDAAPVPAVFNVDGVTPLFNPFNRHIEDYILLERADTT